MLRCFHMTSRWSRKKVHKIQSFQVVIKSLTKMRAIFYKMITCNYGNSDMTWTQHQIRQGSSKYYSSVSSTAPVNVSLSEPPQNGSTPHTKTMWSGSTVLLLSIKKNVELLCCLHVHKYCVFGLPAAEHQIKAVICSPETAGLDGWNRAVATVNIQHVTDFSLLWEEN